MLEIFRVVIKLDNQKLPTITAKKKSTAIQIKKKKIKTFIHIKKNMFPLSYTEFLKGHVFKNKSIVSVRHGHRNH